METGRTTTGDGGRPAQLTDRGKATLVHPDSLRPLTDRTVVVANSAQLGDAGPGREAVRRSEASRGVDVY